MRRYGVATLVLSIAGCALAHERRGGVTSDDAAVIRPDAAPIAIDAGPVVGCEDFWGRLSACPASPMLAIGQPCREEGVTCGVHCCEPGPPIACVGGRWSPVDHMDDCSAVRCAGPHACGAGQCAFGRVCVVPAGELGSAAPETCVVPPAPIDSCGAAPPGSLMTDPGTCVACECRVGPSGDVVVTIDCRCC